MVVAVTALVIAASGTAFAAGGLVSGDSLIMKNSLSGNRLRNRSVTGNKIKVSSLGTVPSATHASIADTATTATTATAAPIAKVTYVSVPVAIPVTSSVPTSSVASCPAGTNVIGGGASITDTVGGLVDDSYPSGKIAWVADFSDFSTATSGTVTAICAPAAATAP
ncbi:MAG TPA: hypothetical protein VMB27_10600 [Solirubrobacteraceae bacterium]|nr:hypothetical protein [Solirubrobacteraceae bacterium]